MDAIHVEYIVLGVSPSRFSTKARYVGSIDGLDEDLSSSQILVVRSLKVTLMPPVDSGDCRACCRSRMQQDVVIHTENESRITGIICERL